MNEAKTFDQLFSEYEKKRNLASENLTLGEFAKNDPDAAARLFAKNIGAIPEDEVPDTSWGDVAKAFNPLGVPVEGGLGFIPESVLWSSLAKHGIDTVKGIPQMPEMLSALTAELGKVLGSEALSEKARAREKAAARAPVDPITRGTVFAINKIKNVIDMAKGDTDIEDLENTPNFDTEYPILSAMMQEYKQKYGSLKGFKYTLANDPFAILIDVAELVAPHLKAVKGASISAKVARGTGKTMEVLNPDEWLGFGLSKGFEKLSDYIKKNPDALGNVEMDFGIDPNTGEKLTFTVNLKELADQYGGVENVPITALVTEDLPKHIEEAVINLYDSKHPYHQAVVKRYEDTAKAIETKRREIVAGEGSPQGAWEPEIVGQSTVSDYQDWQGGGKTELGKEFRANDKVLEQPVRSIEIADTGDIAGEAVKIGSREILPATARQYFPKAVARMEEIIQGDSSTGNTLSNKQNSKIIEDLTELITNVLSDPSQLTLRKIDDMRTDFHQNRDLFARQGEIVASGEGTAAQPLYYAISEDFMDLLEKEVQANPDDFPEGFLEKIPHTRTEYALMQQLEKSEAAKMLRRHQNNPTRLVDNILSPNSVMTTDEIGNLKKIIGDDGWERLRSGLLARVFSKSIQLNSEMGAKGLLVTLNAVNKGSKNRLVTLFGEDMAKTLYESANFQNRVFDKRGKWNTPYINSLMQGDNFGDMIFAAGFVSEQFADEAQKLAEVTGLSRHVSGSKLGIIIGSIVWLGKKHVKRKMFSEAGRRAILEGHSLKIAGLEVKASELALVSEWLEKNSSQLKTLSRITSHGARVGSRVERKKSVRQKIDRRAPGTSLDVFVK